MGSALHDDLRTRLGGIRALFVDVGGVLLRPDTGLLRAALGSEDHPSDDAFDRALYVHGAVGAGLGPGDDDDAFVFDFAISAGADSALVKEGFEGLRTAVLFSPWMPRAKESSLAALALMREHVEHVVIVSNSEGGTVELLSRLEICQVGPGAGFAVSAIVDSFEWDVHKPDPEIYRIAARQVGVDISECLHVGDSVRNDVVAASAAGALAVHFAPYGSCDSDDHLNVDSLTEMAGWFTR